MAEFSELNAAEFKALTLGAQPLVAESAAYDAASEAVVIRLTSGVSIAFPLSVLPGLEAAKPADLADLVIEGRGYGLHVPALDADISIPQLFADQLGSDRMLKNYRRGAASRSNGRMGGRPKKGSKAA